MASIYACDERLTLRGPVVEEEGGGDRITQRDKTSRGTVVTGTHAIVWG